MTSKLSPKRNEGDWCVREVEEKLLKSDGTYSRSIEWRNCDPRRGRSPSQLVVMDVTATSRLSGFKQ